MLSRSPQIERVNVYAQRWVLSKCHRTLIGSSMEDCMVNIEHKHKLFRFEKSRNIFFLLT